MADLTNISTEDLVKMRSEVQPVGIESIPTEELVRLRGQQPAVNVVAPQQPTGIGSEPLSLQQIQQEKLFQIEQVTGQQKQLREFTAKKFLEGNVKQQDMGVFDLIEVVNQAGIFKDFKNRKIALNELKKRDVPSDFIESVTK